MGVGAVDFHVAAGRPAGARKMVLGTLLGVTFETEPMREPEEIVGVASVDEMACHAAVAARRH